MKKHLFACMALFCLFTASLHSQAVSMPIGEWKAHMSYHDATYVVPVSSIIYVLSENSLYTYDTDDSSIQTFDKVSSLSDTEIKQIAYNKACKTLLIVYANSNIDLLINNQEVYNISDFMKKSMTEDKTLNSISMDNEYAYLATNFGIVIVNLKKKEIANTYILDRKVYGCLVHDQTLYAATDEGIYTGKLNENLLDNNNWNKFNDSRFIGLYRFNDHLIGWASEGIYDITAQNTLLSAGEYSYVSISDNRMVAGNPEIITIFNDLKSNKKIKPATDHTIYYLTYSKSNDMYWGAAGTDGLNGYKYNTANLSLEKTVTSIIPDSPKRNLFHYMTFAGNRLLIAGGSLNYSGVDYPGTLMAYEDGKWTSFQEEGIAEATQLQYLNMTSIVQDPSDATHHFASSAAHGVYEFKDYKFVKLHTVDNSSLQTAVPANKYEYVRVNGLTYDQNNNLWMVNNEVDTLLKVMKPNGKWEKFYSKQFTKAPTCERIMFDQRGWVWVTSLRSGGSLTQKQGIYCLNTNKTFDDQSDDQSKFINQFRDQDGEAIQNNYFYCIAEDLNGTIWIGTDKGPLVINNPAKIFDENFYCTRIKVPRNDGTNYADYLLENESITTLYVDGANRKWLGTEGSGIYLISEDGLETIHHFTEENSPLLSNNIQSIAVNDYTGEVFIGTDKGLVSYMGDATLAGDTFSDEAHVFPNPVRPDYNGLITITGLVKDSDVKIVDVSGTLIFSGTSTGGQCTWNGKNKSGKRVASGVYFVLAANSEGKEGIVTKILMIK